jgi:hypothetical protein
MCQSDGNTQKPPKKLTAPPAEAKPHTGRSTSAREDDLCALTTREALRRRTTKLTRGDSHDEL